MNTEHIFKKIRSCGGRLTKIREKIIKILTKTDCLLSGDKLVAKLNKEKICPDRSTLYRELMFLVKNNIILKNTISNIDYYEIPQNHHHHIICVKCQSIKKIEIGNHLKKQEKQIAKQNKFKILNHSLDFFGLCAKCQ